MSGIRHLIRGKERDIGFTVRRLLPAAVAQTVGPFIFLDHMGPAPFAATGTEGDVRPHPHIGLATVTYLFSGAMVHRDSLGSVQRIEPGDVSWMTAGRGIVHSERVPPDVRAAGTAVEGIQMWVALPRALEETTPGFWHHAAASLPVIERPGVHLRVLAGDAFDRIAPVRTPSRTWYVAAELARAGTLDLPPEHAERAVYVAAGAITLDGEPVDAGTLAVLEPGTTVRVVARPTQGLARLMLLGGDPLDGPRFIWWNFVSSSRERIDAAKADWAAEHFTPVPGETERILLPPR